MEPMRTVQKAITRYVAARKELLDVGRQYPGLFGGNDNMIGRIGEFYAIRKLQKMGQSPVKETNSSRKGYDLKDAKTRLRTQVKVISSENKRGRSVRLVEPWDQLVLLYLDSEYKPTKIGILSKRRFLKARKDNPSLSRTPFVKTTMLGPKGLIGKYGTIETA